MYIMGALLRHGSPAQKRRWLPPIASGGLRLQAFGVTEAAAGSDTTQIRTEAVRHGDVYVVNGEKRWTSRLQNSDLMLLLARTSASPPGEKTRGLSLFLVDLREAKGAVRAEPIRVMMNNHTNAVTIRDLRVPAENRIGEEGRGFRYLLDGLNTERILIAAECIGDGRWFIEHACDYSKERVVFDRPIGQNQGVQFPIARAHIAVESADLMRRQASARFFEVALFRRVWAQRADLWPQLFSDVNCIALWISSEKILTRLYAVLHWFHKQLEVNIKNSRENLCFQTAIVFSLGSFDNSNKCTVLWKITAR